MQHSWRPNLGQPGRWRPKAATGLCLAAVAGLATCWALRLAGARELVGTMRACGGLSAAGLRAGCWWQPLTYLFLPGNPRWLLCVQGPLLWLTARHLERIIGRRHLIGLFFVTGAAGGLAQVAYDYWVWPEMTSPTLVGITAPTVGLFVALAGIVPELDLVPPLTLATGSHGPAWRRIKHGAVGLLILLAVMLLARPGGAFAAQEAIRGLAGGLTGCLCVYQLGFGRRRRAAQAADADHAAAVVVAEAVSSSWLDDEPHPLAVAAPVAAAAGALVVPRFTERERRMSARDYITEQIDPILEKISRHGLGSLTETERRVLEKGRDKMTGRRELAGCPKRA